VRRPAGSRVGRRVRQQDRVHVHSAVHVADDFLGAVHAGVPERRPVGEVPALQHDVALGVHREPFARDLLDPADLVARRGGEDLPRRSLEVHRVLVPVRIERDVAIHDGARGPQRRDQRVPVGRLEQPRPHVDRPIRGLDRIERRRRPHQRLDAVRRMIRRRPEDARHRRELRRIGGPHDERVLRHVRVELHAPLAKRVLLGLGDRPRELHDPRRPGSGGAPLTERELAREIESHVARVERSRLQVDRPRVLVPVRRQITVERSLGERPPRRPRHRLRRARRFHRRRGDRPRDRDRCHHRAHAQEIKEGDSSSRHGQPPVRGRAGSGCQSRRPHAQRRDDTANFAPFKHLSAAAR